MVKHTCTTRLQQGASSSHQIGPECGCSKATRNPQRKAGMKMGVPARAQLQRDWPQTDRRSYDESPLHVAVWKGQSERYPKPPRTSAAQGWSGCRKWIAALDCLVPMASASNESTVSGDCQIINLEDRHLRSGRPTKRVDCVSRVGEKRRAMRQWTSGDTL